ncbi:FK506-binding protein 3-like [Syzygium oleosum]|uniref:FK506-binding protein 3-like n=1 Tax=Syzygium oleosum TaxID=219896 RepID=UPI0024B8F1E0|nr:FK506-binding protein 3-like [Syzygium oleosum]
MDIDLEPIPEEESEEEEPEEVEPEIESENEPDKSEQPEEEPEYILPYERYMDPNFVPEYNFFDVLAEEYHNEVPAESGDINHPIVIEAESESSEEQADQGGSDSDDEESDSEWTPSKGRRG